MSARGEAKARGRPREQGEAKERSSRLRARAAADQVEQRISNVGAEAARPRAIAGGRPLGASRPVFDAEAEA
jgi:hypothetical protein